MMYLSHYHFIDVTIFEFFGESTAETVNCGLKRGDVTVSIDMKTDTLARS